MLKNVEMFGIGIGSEVDTTELRGLVSCNIEDHLHLTSGDENPQQIATKILKQLCFSGLFVLVFYSSLF